MTQRGKVSSNNMRKYTKVCHFLGSICPHSSYMSEHCALELPIPSKYLFLWNNLASITIYPYNEANIRGEEKTVHVVFK
jgi:hypothetical protein